MEDIPGASSECPLNRAYIQKIELENFMSHRKFELDFGPDLNIIVGKNGSGKSAILTALTVGLGGSTAKTKRGSGLADLVKHGTRAAYVTITVYNPPGSVKFQEFGSQIIIVKRISIGGGSSLQLKDEHSKTLSTKASDLKDICLNLGFFPDNVLAMLNQESAKEFLISSSPKIKYKNFMDAMRLSDIYRFMESTQKTIGFIQERINSLTREVQRNQDKVKAEELWLSRTRSAQNSATRIAELQGIIAWIVVQESETTRQNAILSRSNLQNEVQSLEAELREIEARLASNDIAQYDQVYNELLEQKNDMTTRIAEYEARIKEEVSEVRNLEQKISEVLQRSQVVDEIQNQLGNQVSSEDVERRRIELTDAEFQLQTKRDDVQQEINRQEQVTSELLEQLKEKEESLVGQKESHKALRDDFEFNRRKQNQLSNGSRQNTFISSSERLLGNYDRKLQLSGVMRAIDNEKRWRRKPYGPIGRYIKVKRRKFEPMLETILDKTLDTFWVLNKQDEKLLSDILRRLGSTASIHTRSKDDDFDLRTIQPSVSQRYARVLDLLQFEDDSFARFLVDVEKIEGMVCCQDQDTANELTRNGQRVDKLIHAFFDRGNGMISRYGGPHYKASEVTSIRAVRHRRLACLDEDPADSADADAENSILLKKEAIRLTAELQASEEELRKKSDILESLKVEYRTKMNSLESAKSTLAKIEADLTSCASELTELAAFDETASSSRRASVEEERQMLDRRLKNLRAKLSEQKQKMEASKAKQQEYNQRLQDVKSRQDENESLREQHQTIRRTGESEKRRVQLLLDSMNSIVISVNERVNAAEAAVAEKLAYAQALEPNRPASAFDNPQAAKLELEEQISALNAALDEAAESIEEIGPREKLLVRLKCTLTESEQDLDDKIATKEQLLRDLEIRQFNSEQSKNKIRTEILDSYREILTKRGYSGSLEFDDDKKTMTLLANPRNIGGDRTATSLSGGEKSFTQLCLLLAIWACMSVSVVAMDEYDVFMDKINRAMSLEALIDTILTSHLQGIFITPQDLEVNVLQKHQANIKIHRLEDPPR